MSAYFEHKWATIEYLIPKFNFHLGVLASNLFSSWPDKYIREDLEIESLETESKSSAKSLWKMNILFPINLTVYKTYINIPTA